jgi:hypothetical protein
MNYDYEIEKRLKPENFQDDSIAEEASSLIAVLQDALDDLDRFSAKNDDIFNYQIDNINEAIKSCRKQL